MCFWKTTTVQPPPPIKSCQEGGRHNFTSMVVKTTPPTPEQLREADVGGFTNGDAATELVSAISAKEYVVCCEWCGQKAEGQ